MVAELARVLRLALLELVRGLKQARGLRLVQGLRVAQLVAKLICQ